MSIWKKPFTLESMSAHHAECGVGHVGIEITEIGDDYLVGRMPVDHRTKQPFGILHGGMSVVLAETIGSAAAFYACPEGYRGVGLDVNANHLRAVSEGWVTATARPVHLGKSTHVWQIDITNDAGELSCVSRLTMAILAPR